MWLKLNNCGPAYNSEPILDMLWSKHAAYVLKIRYLWCGFRSKFVAIIGMELGCGDSFQWLAVLHPLYRLTIKSFASSVEEPDFAIGGSFMANGRVEIAALSRKNAFNIHR